MLNNNEVITVPEYYVNQSLIFFKKAKKYIQNNFPELNSKKINVTGHSLGGALAAFMPALCHFSAKAISFNAPGIATALGVDREVKNMIYAIEARYDFVSKIGEHLGKVFYVDVPNDESIAKQAFTDHKKVIIKTDEIKENKLNLFEVYVVQKEIQGLDEIALHDVLESALAQHQIAHLVSALQKNQNMHLANMLIY